MSSPFPPEYDEITDFIENDALPESTIYHYTNWEGLQGILRNRELWLTNSKNLTDTSEVHYAIDKIQPLCLFLNIVLNNYKINLYLLFFKKKLF